MMKATEFMKPSAVPNGFLGGKIEASYFNEEERRKAILLKVFFDMKDSIKKNKEEANQRWFFTRWIINTYDLMYFLYVKMFRWSPHMDDIVKIYKEAQEEVANEERAKTRRENILSERLKKKSNL